MRSKYYTTIVRRICNGEVLNDRRFEVVRAYYDSVFKIMRPYVRGFNPVVAHGSHVGQKFKTLRRFAEAPYCIKKGASLNEVIF